jgi:hypothetical protein
VAALARFLPRIDVTGTRLIKLEIDGFLRETTDFTQTLKEEKIILQTDFLDEFRSANWRSKPLQELLDRNRPPLSGKTAIRSSEELLLRCINVLCSWIHSKRFLTRWPEVLR